ncbi:hypothetical protein JMM61_20060 [Rhodovulum sulfidophilum]|uniref:hypothetical protein n=1 Tax=Rhodovulum sulfidophilum TaxID=35806 RepID=UPI0019291F8F|nr:hypothetical protein [Rhodovulum sulfidophilum]MBL3587614.1 hypothetical protein [Rhodovulum sulfidophilum]
MQIGTDQMQGPPMGETAFLDWFVGEFMVENLSGWIDDMGTQTCRLFSANGRRYAHHFGIRRDDLVAQFLYLMWAVGPNFWRFPGFAEVLARRDLSEAAKIDALFEVPDKLAARAITEANMDYWMPNLIENNVITGVDGYRVLARRDGDEDG